MHNPAACRTDHALESLTALDGDGEADFQRTEEEARALIIGEIRRVRPDLRHVKVHFTENNSIMVSRSRRSRNSILRLHRIFMKAPQGLLVETVRSFFTRMGRKNLQEVRRRLKEYIETHREEIVLRPFPPRRFLPPEGECFDLQEILDRVVARHFHVRPPVYIAWSRRILRRLMGKWIENPPPFRNLVLINRLLDTPEVPEYYLEFLVFHELLHEALPISRTSGRWVRHCAKFRAREREFPGFKRARAWEAENLDRLYRKHRRKASSRR